MQLPAFTSNDYNGFVNYLLSNAVKASALPTTIQVRVSTSPLPIGGSLVSPVLIDCYVSVLPPTSPVVGSFWLNANPNSTGYATLNLCVYVAASPLWHLCASVHEVMNSSQALTEALAYISQGSGSGGVEFQYSPPLVDGMSAFTLPVLPTGPVKLLFNGVTYREGFDFTRSGVNITWLNSVLIETTDSLTFSYPV